MYTRLRDLREDNDISQAECAKIGYISKNSYIRYENGERNPPLDVIVTYAKFYNVSIDYIAGLTNDKGGLHNNVQSKYNITQKNSPKAVIKIKEEKIMLSNNLKRIRKSKGLSQEELAIKLNVVRQTVSKWENGGSLR